MDDSLRQQLSKRALDLGFDSSQALLRYVSKAIIDGRTVTFGQEPDAWGAPPAHVLARWQKDLQGLEADQRAGKGKSYTNATDMLKDLLADEAN